MKTLLKKLILSFVLIFATSMNIGAKVVSYPVPQTEPLSSDYTVEVNGITIPVCARLISPGWGKLPPPVIATVEMVW